MAVDQKAVIDEIAEWHASIQAPGTPEKGYTDSGLWNFLPYVFTKDSHEDNPVRKLPVAEKRYLQVVFLYMLCCKVLAIPKSRQTIISWAVCAFDVWTAMRAPYREVIYQTQKEKDAHAMVSQGRKNPAGGRMDFIIQYLPDYFKDPNIASGVGNMVGELVFTPASSDPNGVPVPWSGSSISAVPGGPDQVRGKTPTKFTFDEAAFHSDFAESWAAVKPAVSGGGSVHAISSPFAGSDFNALVLESPTGDHMPHRVHPDVQRALDILGWGWPKGLESWQTPSGTWVLKVHYTADPAKDPERDGAAWFVEAQKGYPGGIESPKWKREMEIDFEAGGGSPVFPFLIEGSPIYIDEIPVDEVLLNMDLYAGYDYGTVSDAHFVVVGFDSENQPHTVWELAEPADNLDEHCAKIKACPYFDHLKYKICDPAIMTKNQQTAKGMGSVSEQFADRGIHFTAGRRGAAEPTAVLMKSTYWKDPLNPHAFITRATPKLWKQMSGLKYDVHTSAMQAAKKNSLETIMDKDNHGPDAFFYLLDSRPVGKTLPKERKFEGFSYDEAIAKAKGHQPTENIHGIMVV